MSTSDEMTNSDMDTSANEPSVPIKDLIRELLKQHQFLHQYRVQKLVYLMELLHTEKHNGSRLTDAKYRPYMYGVYSKDVDKALSDLESDSDIKVKKQRKYGNETTTYVIKNDTSSDNAIDTSSDEATKLAELVTNLTRSMSSDDLADWSKSTYLFNDTEFDDEMQFDKYAKKVNRDEINPDWKKLT